VAVLEKNIWGPGHSLFGRQQRLSEIAIEPIKNVGAWARFGGPVLPGRSLKPPLPIQSRLINVVLCLMVLYSADGKYEVSYKPNVVIRHVGDVLWIPPAIYRSSCPISVKYFPFDEQKCEMKFGSWTFNSDQVNSQAPACGEIFRGSPHFITFSAEDAMIYAP